MRFAQDTFATNSIRSYSDGEISVEIGENVRGKDVFIIQPTCAPTNDNLMELIVMIDAMRRASVKRVTAVVPYYGYSRQDRKPRSARVPITAKVVANMLASVKLDRLLTVDLHADQIQGFFDLPVDNVYASPILLKDIWQQRHDNLLVVSPDVGGVVRARALAKRLGDADLAIIDKRRPKANVSEVMNIIGDVTGKSVSGALIMSASRSVFRMLSEEQLSVGETMMRANRRIKQDVTSGMFVALLYVQHRLRRP